MDIFLVSGHQNAVRTYICVDKMDEKKDGHMQITAFFDISHLDVVATGKRDKI